MISDSECMKNRQLRTPSCASPARNKSKCESWVFCMDFALGTPANEHSWSMDFKTWETVGQIATLSVEIPLLVELFLFSCSLISAFFCHFCNHFRKGNCKAHFPQPHKNRVSTAPPVMVHRTHHQAGISKQTPVARRLCEHHHHPEWRAACNCACRGLQSNSLISTRLWDDMWEESASNKQCGK